MRGHIEKRYKNSYTIRLNLGRDPATGKRKQQTVSVKGTKKEAERKLAELIHQLDTGSYRSPGKITLGEFLKKWLADYARPNLAPTTYINYESMARCHIIPSLGAIQLTRLHPGHIQQFYAASQAAGTSAMTIRHHHTLLHKALVSAVKEGRLSHNPADAVDIPRSQSPEMEVMSEDGINLFLEAAAATAFYEVFFLALFTGMRRSEYLALRWSDVDLLLCQISVSRSVHLIEGEYIFRPTKTTKGRRQVALSPATAIMLRDYRERQVAIRETLELPQLTDEDLVFLHLDGGPLNPTSVSKAWAQLVKRLKLGHVRLHDARHTHASLLLKQGVHPKIVQERLGHANIQITLDTYSHVVPGLQHKAAEAFDLIVKPEGKKESV